MSIPVCVHLPELPDAFSLPLPGGVDLEDIDPMRLLQPALTPLVPIFNIIDAVAAIATFAKAVPAGFGAPPDLTAMAAALPEVAKKTSKLLGLVPQLSVPRMVVRMLTLATNVLRRARSQLRHLQTRIKQVDAIINRAKELDDPGLRRVAACTRANVEQEAANVGKSLASVGKLLGLVNLFLGLIGGPTVPDVKGLSGLPLDEMIPPLDELVKVLEAARDAIPLP